MLQINMRQAGKTISLEEKAEEQVESIQLYANRSYSPYLKVTDHSNEYVEGEFFNTEQISGRGKFKFRVDTEEEKIAFWCEGCDDFIGTINVNYDISASATYDIYDECIGDTYDSYDGDIHRVSCDDCGEEMNHNIVYGYLQDIIQRITNLYS